MSYQVFLVEYLGVPLNHHAIFVETTPENGTGYIFQVIGNIQNGMEYENKVGYRPEESQSFVSKSFLGSVDAVNYGRIGEICSSIPPPKKQFQGSRRLYPGEPLRRCHEWTQDAIAELSNAGVLQ
ncbi:hypothetical protein MKZ38_007201 [Zalerion maritima]|uniref:Uncharacterized protein n=1 Tax=Zalerion maritima TaxID=339359 RepID=A0AAD5WPC3_9PEZI|nr:hypothetical protein MKZ38_007201 [Zalerion maritima]